MDPWLELFWRDVHASMIIYIRDQLQPHLPAPLVARAEEDVCVDVEEDSPGVVRPDVEVVEDDAGSGGTTTLAPVAVAKPVLLRVPEPEVDRRVEIIDPRSGGRVVTAIEVLSPARDAYQSKQRDFLRGGVNLVEIDLVRAGNWVFSVDEGALAPSSRAPYMVCVFRMTKPGVRALYKLPLRERLPRIAIPLRPRDQDVALDLQQSIDEVYERGRYDRTDYRRPLTPPLSPEDEVWATELLRKEKRL